jgi:hypothetical protein
MKETFSFLIPRRRKKSETQHAIASFRNAQNPMKHRRTSKSGKRGEEKSTSKERGSLYLFTTSPETTLALGEQALGASASALHEILALGLDLVDICVSSIGASGRRGGSSASSACLALTADLEDGWTVLVARTSDRASQAGDGVAQTSRLDDSRTLILLTSGVCVLGMGSEHAREPAGEACVHVGESVAGGFVGGDAIVSILDSGQITESRDLV